MNRYLYVALALIALAVMSASSQVPAIDADKTINLATGEMETSIPLDNVNISGNYKFPLTLSYRSGIRFHQEASPVGLGFNMGAGSIVRNIVYVADENTGGTDSYQRGAFPTCTPPKWRTVVLTIVQIVGFVVGFIAMAIPGGQAAGGYLMVASFALTGAQIALSNVHYDLENYTSGGTHVAQYDYENGDGKGFFNGGENYDLPDFYLVSTPFVSGQLVWVGDAGTGHYVFTQTGGSSADAQKTIEVTHDTPEAFKIVMPDGTRLYFDVVLKEKWVNETYGVLGSCSYNISERQKEMVNMQWYLTKVLFPDYVGSESAPSSASKGSWILFNYDAVNDYFEYGNDVGVGSGRWYQVSSRDVTVKAAVDYGYHFLRSVVTPNETAEFSYEYDRLDVYRYKRVSVPVGGGGYVEKYVPFLFPRLKQITIKNNETIARKRINFVTDYELRPGTYDAMKNPFLSEYIDYYYKLGTDGQLTTSTSAVAPNHKEGSLTLKSITIEGADQTTMPPIVFHYGSNPELDEIYTNLAEGGMPYYVEWKDVWGYFNPKGAEDEKNDLNSEGSAAKALRGSGFAYADAWSLTKMYMPSGQSIQWTYEACTYDSANNSAVTSGGGAPKYGGGIRVKEIAVDNGLGKVERTSLFYTDVPGNFIRSSSTSGFATVEPYSYIDQYDEWEDPRPMNARGGLYAPAKVMYGLVQAVKNYVEPTTGKPNGEAPYGYTVYRNVTPGFEGCQNGGTYGEVDRSWKRGMLESVSFFSKDYKRVSCKHYTYGYKQDYNQRGSIDLSNPDKLMEVEIGWARLEQTIDTIDGVRKVQELKYADQISGADGRTVQSRHVYQFSGTKSLRNEPCSNGQTYGVFGGVEGGFTYQIGTSGNLSIGLVNACYEGTGHTEYVCETVDGLTRCYNRCSMVDPYQGTALDIYLAKNVNFGSDASFGITWSNPLTVSIARLDDPPPFVWGDKDMLLGAGFLALDGDNIKNDLVINYKKIESSLNYGLHHFELRNIDVDANGNITCASCSGGPAEQNGNLTLEVFSPAPTLHPSSPWHVMNSMAVGSGGITMVNANNIVRVVNDTWVDVLGDRDGQPNQTIEYAAGGTVYRVTLPLHAYWFYGGMSDKHMLTQLCGTEIRNNTSFDDGNLVRASATTWDAGSGAWRPRGNYVWTMPMNAGGTAAADYDGFDYDKSDGDANNYAKWVCKSYDEVQDKYGHVNWLSTNAGASGFLHTTTAYGHKSTLPTATILGAGCYESGVFTGDYNDNEYDEGTLYLDVQSGWELRTDRGYSGTGTVEVTEAKKHFGEKSIHVVNAYGPSRNCRIREGRDYILSAWVYVQSGNVKLYGDYRYRPKSGDTHWPVHALDHWRDISTSSPRLSGASGGWQKLEFYIPATKDLATGTDWDNNNYYIRVGIGNPEQNYTGDVYIDDIRFYPTNALVTTTYYHPVHQLPVCTVDPNNQPSQFVVYDGLMRPQYWFKIDRTKSRGPDSGDKLVIKKEYHLMQELMSGEHIRMQYPNGGEQIPVSQPFRFRWVNDGTRDVQFYLNKDGGEYGPLLGAHVDNCSGYNDVARWGTTGSVEIRLTEEAIGHEFNVKVVDKNDANISDASDQTFTIIADP